MKFNPVLHNKPPLRVTALHNKPPLRVSKINSFVKVSTYRYIGVVAVGCSKVAARLVVASRCFHSWVAARLRLQVAAKLQQSCRQKRVFLDTKLQSCSIFTKTVKSIYEKTPATAATCNFPSIGRNFTNKLFYPTRKGSLLCKINKFM